MNNGLILARLKNITGKNFACFAPLPSFADMQDAMLSYVVNDVPADDPYYHAMEEAARSLSCADTDKEAFALYAEQMKYFAQIKEGRLPRSKAFKYLDDVFFPAPEQPAARQHRFKKDLHQ